MRRASSHLVVDSCEDLDHTACVRLDVLGSSSFKTNLSVICIAPGQHKDPLSGLRGTATKKTMLTMTHVLLCGLLTHVTIWTYVIVPCTSEQLDPSLLDKHWPQCLRVASHIPAHATDRQTR